MTYVQSMSAIIIDFLLSETSKKQAAGVLRSFARLNYLKSKIPTLLKENRYKDVAELCDFLACIDSVLQKCNKK